VREFYAPFDTGPKSGTAEVYCTRCPAASTPICKEQAESMGLGARWHEIARTYADVNMAFGDIVKVTPSSKVVGDMAIFLANHNMTMEQFELPHAGPQPHAARLGDRDVHGRAGRAGGRLAEEAAEAIILRGAKPQRGRPGAHLPPVDFEETAARWAARSAAEPAPTKCSAT
jgi:pyruvate carboxylase